MANYSKSTNFASKDALLSGDPLKVIKGTEIDDEFEAIETAMATKADLASPTFTGTPKAPTAAAGTNTTQLATTAFVTDAVDTAVNNLPADSVCSAQIAANCVTADELDVGGDGTSGQVLISDGDGSFSWYSLPGGSSNPLISPSATDPTQRDDASALQEGDIYYNTSLDTIKTYDGSSWNLLSVDYAAGETGTTTIPAVGSLVFGSIEAPTSSQGLGGTGGSDYMWSGGYGSTLTCTSTSKIYIRYKGYDYYSATYGYTGDSWGAAIIVTSGTWKFLGGANDLNSNDRQGLGLFVRTA